MRMRYIILPSVACPTIPYSFTLLHKRNELRGGGGGYKNVDYKVCFLFCLQRFSETFLI